MLLDTIHLLKSVADDFKTYSASDINKLIISKLRTGRNPEDLKKLYELEGMIHDVRMELERAANARILRIPE